MTDLLKMIDFVVATKSGLVTVQIPVRWDAEVEEWVMTREGHDIIDKTKRGSPDPDPITR